MIQNIQRNELHYYIDLLRIKSDADHKDTKQLSRENDTRKTALRNIIRTMQLSRNNRICNENLSHLDFSSLSLTKIHFSMFGEYSSDFHNSIFNLECFISGFYHIFSDGTISFSTTDKLTVSKKTNTLAAYEGNDLIIWDILTTWQLGKYKIGGSPYKEPFNRIIKIFFFLSDNKEYIAIILTKEGNEELLQRHDYSVCVLDPISGKDYTDVFLDTIDNEIKYTSLEEVIRDYISETSDSGIQLIDFDMMNSIGVSKSGEILHFGKGLAVIQRKQLGIPSERIKNAFLCDNSRKCVLTTTDNMINVFDIQGGTGEPLYCLGTTPKIICDISFSTDSKYIFVWLVDEIAIIDVEKRQFIHSSKSDLQFEYLPDGTVAFLTDTVMENDNYYVRRRNASRERFISYVASVCTISEERLDTIMQSSKIRNAALTADKQYIFVYDNEFSSEPTFIKTENGIPDLEICRSLIRKKVVSLSFSKDNKYCVIASANGHIYMCDSHLQSIIYIFYCIPGVYMGNCNLDNIQAPNVLIELMKQYNLDNTSPNQRSLSALYELVDGNRMNSMITPGRAFTENESGEIENITTMLKEDYPLISVFYSNRLNRVYSIRVSKNTPGGYYVCRINNQAIVTNLIGLDPEKDSDELNIVIEDFLSKYGIYPPCIWMDNNVYLVVAAFFSEKTKKHYIIFTDELTGPDGTTYLNACIFTPGTEKGEYTLSGITKRKDWKIIEKYLNQIY